MADDKIVRIPKELHERWDAVCEAIRKRHVEIFAPAPVRVTQAAVIGEMLLFAEDRLGILPQGATLPPDSADRYLVLMQQALDLARRAEAMALAADPDLANETEGDS